MTVQPRGKMDGASGENPDQEGARHINHLKVSWADRQLATAMDGDTLYVNNRFHLAAYDLRNGQRLWQSTRPPEKMLRSQDWALAPMQPLLMPSVIYVRQLFGLGPMLVCLDRATGQIKWTMEQRANEETVSDPLWSRGRLITISLVRSEHQEGELRLTETDPQTGYILGQQFIARVRDSWWQRRFLTMAADESRLYIALGGAVLCCDVRGQLIWVRRQSLLPSEEESGWVTQAFDSLRIVGGKLFVSQPGVRSIECIEAETGNLIWRATLPDTRRIIHANNQHVLVETDDGWVGLSVTDGHVDWARNEKGLLHGVCADDVRWIYVKREPLDKQASRNRVRMVWADTASGREIGSTLLGGLEEADPRVGPIVPYKDRLFTFFGRGQNDAQRDVIELIPQGEPLPPSLSSASQSWLRHIPENVRDAGQQILPSWTLLQGEGGDQTGLLAEIHGEKDAASVRIRAAAPVVFGRQLTLPNGALPKLRIKIGNEPIQAWRLEVRWNGQSVWQQELQEATHPQRWKEFETVLPSLAGKTGWLTIRAQLIAGGDGTLTYWKRLELVL